MTPILEKIVFAGGGALVSLAIAYWAVGREIAWIKGAMTALVGIAKEFQDEKIARVLLKQDVQKAQADVNAAHVQIRDLKKRR
jgi:hypothetical protein